MNKSSPSKSRNRYLWLLALSAVGIVYGDIGTSPLYAFRECFYGAHSISVSHENVLGVLSLIFYSLIIVITIKYLLVILRADNEGEGGILALMETVLPQKKKNRFTLLMVLGLFGAALLYGDGMITPAISVLSAIEGLETATPVFKPYILPITIGVLFGLFFFQKKGSGGVGKIFGPVMTIWFLTIALLGILSIVNYPEILQALNPAHAYLFFKKVGFKALYVLGAIFLVVTGGEALYADLGHFGRKPIRLSWIILVLPCLLLNYFGQGALLLRNPELAENPFYYLCPEWMIYGMVILATAATVIASQAVISGAFSLTFQAVQLGYLPRIEIRHTSEKESGQIYIPPLNWILFVATVILVVSFRTSSNLAGAYGVAISTTMVITDILLFIAMRDKWKWNILIALVITIFFMVIDLGFLTANLIKILKGGWVPLFIAAFIYTLMATWRKGRRMVSAKIGEVANPIEKFVSSLKEKDFERVKGIAIYMSSNSKYIPPALEKNLKHNQVLHEKIILLTIKIQNIPYLRKKRHWSLKTLGKNFYQIMAEYGYFQRVDVQQLIRSISEEEKKLKIDPEKVTYFLGRENLINRQDIGMNRVQGRLFELMSDNAQDATRFFHLPVTRVFEVGQQVNV